MSWISSANNVTGYRLQELQVMVAVRYKHVFLDHVQMGYVVDSDSLSKRLPRDFSTVKFDPSHKSSAEVKDRENFSSALLLVFTGVWGRESMR